MSTIEAPEAAAEAPEQPAAPTVKVTVSGAKGAPKRTRIEGESVLAAMGRAATSSWTVNRIAAPGFPGARTGNLPRDFSTEEVTSVATLSGLVGGGTYKITNSADPSKSFTIDLATQTPPVEFGTPAEDDDEGYVVQTPSGPAYVPASPRGQRAPRGFAAGYSAGFQPPWAPPPGQSVAREVTDALKPMLEMQTKLLEKFLDRKPDGPSPDVLLKLEQMKADARVAEAKEARLAREAELKAKEVEARERATLEREIAKENAKAAAEASKANADAARAQAEAFQKAQAESARATIEAAKESARAQIEASKEAAKVQAEVARERAQSEKSMLDRYIQMQERVAASVPEQPTLIEQMQQVKTMMSFMGVGGQASGTLAVVDRIVDGGKSILGQLLALKAQPIVVQHAGAPGAPAPAQIAAKPDTPPEASGTMAPEKAKAILTGGAAPQPNPPDERAQREAAAHELKRQILDGLKTLLSGAQSKADPKRVAGILREKLPAVYDWLKRAAPEDVLSDLAAMVQTDAFTPGEQKQALEARAALAEHLAWLIDVVAAVKS